MKTDTVELKDMADSPNNQDDQIIKVMVNGTFFSISNIGGQLTITKPRQLNGGLISIFPNAQNQIGIK